MMKEKDLLKWQWPFFLSFIVINFTGLLVTAYFGKEELHLYFNKNWHNSFFDFFFKYYTDVATNGVMIASLLYIIWKKTRRDFYFLSISLLSASLFSRLIKRGLFVHGHRPTFYFESRGVDLHLIEGVSSQIPYTFPSGHAFLATILCFYWCLNVKNRIVQILMCIGMALVFIGRVYLSKHWVLDTVGGSFIGIFFVILFYYLIWKSPSSDLNKKLFPLK